jgi:hypothetical protein
LENGVSGIVPSVQNRAQPGPDYNGIETEVRASKPDGEHYGPIVAKTDGRFDYHLEPVSKHYCAYCGHEHTGKHDCSDQVTCPWTEQENERAFKWAQGSYRKRAR